MSTEVGTKPLSENYYDLLGVSRTASTDEITDAEIALRRVYEARSKRGDAQATDILRRLNEAHSQLTVDHRRAEYDRDAAAMARGFADVAYSPQVGRFQKLREVGAWLAGDDPVRACTLLDVPTPPDTWRIEPLLGDAPS